MVEPVENGMREVAELYSIEDGSILGNEIVVDLLNDFVGRDMAESDVVTFKLMVNIMNYIIWS